MKVKDPSYFFSKNIPSFKKCLQISKMKSAFVICDKRFEKSRELKSWRQNSKAQFLYLKSGEKTKSLEEINRYARSLTKLLKDSQCVFIGIGGGSVLDLTGFLSSIYKRGRPLILIPTNWLSALDSAHGGKNAVNFGGIKNVFGTYHFPKACFLVESFLEKNSDKLKKEASFELLKMALIKGNPLYKDLKKYKESEISKLPFFSFLKPAIKAKMQIVKRDPFDKKERRKLNLGHTLGHILESSYPLSHGEAVAQGLLFSLEWSHKKNFLKKEDLKDISSFLKERKKKKIPLPLFKKLLREDKKQTGKKRIDFVFVKKPGEVFIKSVLEKDLILEAKRQNLV